MVLIPALLGALGALGGCVRPPPPPLAQHHRPVYRPEPELPPVEASTEPAHPALPLPVPPEPVSPAAATDCAPATSGGLSEARKQQLFKEFSQLESGKPNPPTATPSSQAGHAASPPCPPAH